jgi:hypothetical protein
LVRSFEEFVKVKFTLDSFKQTEWHEYAIRFLAGGLITVATGLIAQNWGPVVGGLFLAFPAIFPAGATLIERSEKKKKEKAGFNVCRRGLDAAALDAQGSAMGGLGMILFGVIVWLALPLHPSLLVLVAGLFVWLVTCITVWTLFELA